MPRSHCSRPCSYWTNRNVCTVLVKPARIGFKSMPARLRAWCRVSTSSGEPVVFTSQLHSGLINPGFAAAFVAGAFVFQSKLLALLQQAGNAVSQLYFT